MKLKVIIHEAEEGGYWAEVPAIPGCATQGETFEELLENIYEAIEACLSVDIDAGNPSKISVPIHGNKDLKIGLLRNLLKTAGLLENILQEKPCEEGVDELIDEHSDAVDVD
jgi:predicted RNase H-like HicB family nuclease